MREIQGFSPTVQPSQPAAAQAASDDTVRRINHLEDKMEIMNEKLDLILREIRNIYETGAGRRA